MVLSSFYQALVVILVGAYSARLFFLFYRNFYGSKKRSRNLNHLSLQELIENWIETILKTIPALVRKDTTECRTEK